MRKYNQAYINWIVHNMNNHQDPITDEYNYTTITEELAAQFNLYEDEIDYEIPEDVFDMVLNIVDKQS